MVLVWLIVQHLFIQLYWNVFAKIYKRVPLKPSREKSPEKKKYNICFQRKKHKRTYSQHSVAANICILKSDVFKQEFGMGRKSLPGG